jgi:hypothetical protein
MAAYLTMINDIGDKIVFVICWGVGEDLIKDSNLLGGIYVFSLW